MKTKNLWFAAGAAIGAGALSYALVRRYQKTLAESLAWQRQRRPALDVLACPDCHAALQVAFSPAADGYFCPACHKEYPVVDGIPHFIKTEALTGWNKGFAGM